MARLESTPFVVSGLDPTDGEPCALTGDYFISTGREILSLANYSGGAVDVTIETTVEIDEQPVDDIAVTLQDGSVRLLGPWPLWLCGQKVRISYSSNSNVFVRVFQFNFA